MPPHPKDTRPAWLSDPAGVSHRPFPFHQPSTGHTTRTMTSLYLVLDIARSADTTWSTLTVLNGRLAARLRVKLALPRPDADRDREGAAPRAYSASASVRVGFSPDITSARRSSPIFGGAAPAGPFKLGSWRHGDPSDASCRRRPRTLQVPSSTASGRVLRHQRLMAQLRALAVPRVIYCVHGCVDARLGRAGDAPRRADRDFEVVVLEDCCAAHSEHGPPADAEHRALLHDDDVGPGRVRMNWPVRHGLPTPCASPASAIPSRPRASARRSGAALKAAEMHRAPRRGP